MKHFPALVLLIFCIFGAAAARADTQVSMTGDARIYANFWSKYQYTGWNYNGTQTADTATIWERFRLQTDFVANDNLKFRLAIRVDDSAGKSAWGSGTFTVDNPAVCLEVYNAYLDFKWPNTELHFTVGYQNFDLPFSADWMGANPVMGGTTVAGAVVEIPVADAFKIVTGAMRLLDSDKSGFAPKTTQVVPDLDGYFLSLPITLDGFKATPWGMVAVAGRNADYAGTGVGDSPNSNESLATNLFSAASAVTPSPFRNSRNVYWWVGTTVAVTALDPFKFYGDIMYGAGNEGDHGYDKRSGMFFDVAAEYAGFDIVNIQTTFWYSPGEDSSMSNGSERMPSVVDYWGPTNSFLFNSGQELNFGFMGVNPVGSWGLVAGLDKISFIKDLTNRLVFSFAQGTNSPTALRNANLLAGTGNYVQIGRDLTTKEHVLAVNLDTHYDLNEHLAVIVETGWSHGDFQTSVWGHRFTNQTRDGDAWKVGFGLAYKF
jgi:hypothetical protein